LEPKFLNTRNQIKRNAKGSSITINFHPRRGEETYVKAKKKKKKKKKFKIFADVLCCTSACSNEFFTLKRKLEFLPKTSQTFTVILSAVALPIVPKVELNFEVILYITVFPF